MTDYYEELAEESTGLIISGYAYIMKQGQQTPGQMGINDDSLEGEHKKLTQAVHQSGGKVFIQMFHMYAVFQQADRKYLLSFALHSYSVNHLLKP